MLSNSPKLCRAAPTFCPPRLPSPVDRSRTICRRSPIVAAGWRLVVLLLSRWRWLVAGRVGHVVAAATDCGCSTTTMRATATGTGRGSRCDATWQSLRSRGDAFVGGRAGWRTRDENWHNLVLHYVWHMFRHTRLTDPAMPSRRGQQIYNHNKQHTQLTALEVM